MTKYIVTDPDSGFVLEKGKHYFMDFDVSQMPFQARKWLSAEAIKDGFTNEMWITDHDVKQVTVQVGYPDFDTVRISFIANPLPVAVLVVICIGVLLVAAGLGGGLFAFFKGLGEGGPIPVVIETAIKNPVAVIAIIIAVAVLLLGVKI